MRKRTLTWITMLSLLVLAACGAADDGTTDTSNTGDDAAADDNPALTLNVTGDVTTEYAGRVNFSCEGSGMANVPGRFELVMTNGTEQMYLSMPEDVEPGTYALVGSDDQGVTAADYYIRYRSEERDTYDVNGTGELTIESMPSAVGEQFVATFNATLAFDDAPERTVTLAAVVNTTAPSWAFESCEEDS